MLTLLRKIRKSLIDTGGARKYTLYAIGEIALVVVGILIALQINNWNQKRLEKAKSIEYHERLIEDLDYVIGWAEGDIKHSKDMYEKISLSVKFLENQTWTDSSKQVLNYVLARFNEYLPFDASLSTYEEMKSSGHIGLIYNPEVRREISGYLAFWEVVNSIYDLISVQINDLDFIVPYIQRDAQNPTSETLKYDFDVLASDPIVINRLSRHALDWNGKANWVQEIVRRAEALKSVLEESLEEM